MNTSKRGKPRKKNPNIPKHIDQSKIPTGVYYDARGRGRWYLVYRNEAGVSRSQTIADSKATLSELHRIMELRQGIDRYTLRYLCDQFHSSAQFKALMPKTQKGYEYCREIVVEWQTQTGMALGDLATERFSQPLIQRLVDRIANEGKPTKANSVLRYLRRLFRWGMNRGHCKANPATGVEAAKERKLRRLPGTELMERVIQYAKDNGADFPKRGQSGTCPAYLWMIMELAYLCRLRGIEVVTLTDANALTAGIMTNRRKGSRDNIVRWSPRLRQVWAAAQARRVEILEQAHRMPAKHPENNPLFVSRSGEALKKSSLDTAWQRFMTMLIKDEVIKKSDRFGLHDLKRQGITDTAGTRHEKQEASGHRSGEMMDVYDLSIPIVLTPEREK